MSMLNLVATVAKIGNALNYAPQVVRETKESNRVVIKAERLRRRLISVVGKWKDHHVLKILDWTYKPEEEQSLHNWNGEVDAASEDEEIKVFVGVFLRACVHVNENLRRMILADGGSLTRMLRPFHHNHVDDTNPSESWLAIMYATEPVILVSQGTKMLTELRNSV
ncbi:hypothetical protein ACFX2G_002614 [Malus domestica]